MMWYVRQFYRQLSVMRNLGSFVGLPLSQKKNKLFDCPLITFQRVGRWVGIFFFFTFKCWMLKLCSIWTDSNNSTSLHRPPGCCATWTRFTSLPEHVMSSPVNTSTIKSEAEGFSAHLSPRSPTPIHLATPSPSLSSSDKQRIESVFFSYKILMKKISQNHKINFFSLIF